ncbi:MAG: DinB family protein [Anaerolineae bacterium]|nr:DinB family protein [Anaerolineae bacterium]
MNETDRHTHNALQPSPMGDLRLLERCAELTPEQLDATIPGAYSSIYDTLQHIVTTEQSYFSRISTGQPYRRPSNAPRMTQAEMADALRATGSGLVEWAPKIQAGDMVEIDWEGTPRAVPKAIVLAQVINHATEHREQIKAILTQLGIEPPDLQAWSFF